MYQPSYFATVHALFEIYLDQNNKAVLQKLYNIYLKLI